MSTSTNSCSCSSAPTLIFACSGAADVGALADRAARKMAQEGAGKMYCLAGLGAGFEDMIANTRTAGRILAIDGCPKDCAYHTLHKAGFPEAARLRVTDEGFAKGATPITEENIAAVAAKGAAVLQRA